MKSFVPGWYVVYTKPRHEKKVSHKLAQLEIGYFLPTMRSLHYWHDRKKFVEFPLFPCYIFVYLKSIQDYYAGLNIEGVWRYLRDGVNIARVGEKIIENIRRSICQGSDVEVSDGYFKPGQVLTIQRGVFTGLCCEVVQVNGNKKLLVRIDLLKRVILLSIPAEQMA